MDIDNNLFEYSQSITNKILRLTDAKSSEVIGVGLGLLGTVSYLTTRGQQLLGISSMLRDECSELMIENYLCVDRERKALQGMLEDLDKTSNSSTLLKVRSKEFIWAEIIEAPLVLIKAMSSFRGRTRAISSADLEFMLESENQPTNDSNNDNNNTKGLFDFVVKRVDTDDEMDRSRNGYDNHEGTYFEDQSRPRELSTDTHTTTDSCHYNDTSSNSKYTEDSSRFFVPYPQMVPDTVFSRMKQGRGGLKGSDGGGTSSTTENETDYVSGDSSENQQSEEMNFDDVFEEYSDPIDSISTAMKHNFRLSRVVPGADVPLSIHDPSKGIISAPVHAMSKRSPVIDRRSDPCLFLSTTPGEDGGWFVGSI